MIPQFWEQSRLIHSTGKRVTYAGVAVFRIEAGHILKGWVLGDVHGLMRQLSGDGA